MSKSRPARDPAPAVTPGGAKAYEIKKVEWR